LTFKTKINQLLHKRVQPSSIPYISPILTQPLAAPGRKTGLIPEC